MLPLLQLSDTRGTARVSPDIDLRLTGEVSEDTATVLRSMCAVASGESIPKANAGGFVDFQLSRGLLGVST
jgi:hypothetical protein